MLIENIQNSYFCTCSIKMSWCLKNNTQTFNFFMNVFYLGAPGAVYALVQVCSYRSYRLLNFLATFAKLLLLLYSWPKEQQF